MKYYIAYGSNLNVSQMSVRCPTAIPIGTTILEDWRLVFHTHLNIEVAPGHNAPAVVWEIEDGDEQALDCYEGYPDYYIKRVVSVWVHMFGGGLKRINAMVYIMRYRHWTQMPPTAAYYRIVREGYDDFGFEASPLEEALNNAARRGHRKFDEDKGQNDG